MDPLTAPPKMRIAIAQLNFTIGAFESNLALIRHAAERARKKRVQLLVFSELAVCGYPPRDLLEHPDFVDQNLRTLDQVARLSDDRMAIICGFADRATHKGAVRPLHNAAAVCYSGAVRHRVHKTLLPTYDVFDEDRYFEPSLPASVKPIKIFGLKIGVTICEDIWTDGRLLPGRDTRQNPAESLIRRGAGLLVNISASPFTLGQAAQRRQLVSDLAREHKVPVVYANQVGANDELIFDGHSMAVNADGTTAARARDFAEDFLLIDMDWKDRLWRVGTDDPPANAENPLEETRRALVLGVRDYLYKTNHKSALIGLSGGIDSALTATLAAEALGPENVLGVAMPSRHSPGHSLADAQALATNLGIHYRVVPIEPAFQVALDTLNPFFEGFEPDVTEENIQARIRGMLLMAMSNKYGSLVLTTGNKSELAVGYCTLYGDMCGGLAVISDLPKTLVYALSQHINQLARIHGLPPRIPENTLTKPPSAELRPDQTDLDTLPDYKTLDRILELHIEELRPADQICRLEGFAPALVEKILALVHRNEFKRRQAAPGLKITSKAFGVGRCFPIVAMRK